jgi:hypothetical protein
VNPLLLHTAPKSTATSWQDRILALASRPSAATPAVSSPSVVYEPAATPVDVATYADPSRAAVDPSSDQAIGALMARHAASGSAGSALAGLGQALLGRFRTEGANFQANIAAATGADSAISLAIHTASGATIKLALNASAHGLSVSLSTDRTLSDSEKQAAAALASAFQDAVDGLGKQPPTLALDGLLATDPSILTSIDLAATVATSPGVHETIAFHAGSDSRSLKVDGPAGSIAMDLDMSQPATWGSRAQRDASVAAYLDQVDVAALRGHANATLAAMFKDGFSQLNSHYPATPGTATTRGTTRDLSGSDHALLTGLADFNASISQASNASNPLRADELDTFNYDISQSTTLSGRNASDRHITQAQASHLTASFHTSPWPDAPLNLTTQRGSQNYNYTQIDDSAHASTDLAYAKGKLMSASISHDASQDTHVKKYMAAQLVEETDTPSHRDVTRDLLPLLTDLARPGARDDGASLNSLHAYGALQADPATLGR